MCFVDRIGLLELFPLVADGGESGYLHVFVILLDNNIISDIRYYFN